MYLFGLTSALELFGAKFVLFVAIQFLSFVEFVFLLLKVSGKRFSMSLQKLLDFSPTLEMESSMDSIPACVSARCFTQGSSTPRDPSGVARLPR